MPRSSSSDSSSYFSSSSASSGRSASTRYRTHRLPNTPAINILKWCTGRNPRKVTGVRVYETYYPEPDYETSSDGSRRSAWSWQTSGPRKEVQIVLLESRHGPYWGEYYGDEDDEDEIISTTTTRRRVSSRAGGGRHSSGVPVPGPAFPFPCGPPGPGFGPGAGAGPMPGPGPGWGHGHPPGPPGPAGVDIVGDDDEDDDDDSSDGSFSQPQPFPPQGPRPGMPPMMQGAAMGMGHPPPAGFQQFRGPMGSAQGHGMPGQIPGAQPFRPPGPPVFPTL